jgi:hypothetical protein
MKLSFRTRNLEKVQEFLRQLPKGSTNAAIRAFSEYILGDDTHGLRHMVVYKFVSRKAAFGFSFFTDKQRRWFFAALNDGRIDPGSGERHDTTRGWKMVGTAGGSNYRLTTNKPSAIWTMSDNRQSRQAAKVGHRKVSDVVRSNMAGALRAAVTAVNNWIKERVK